MKNLFLSAIFAVVAFTCNAQVVTINIFQTQDLTALDSTFSVREVIDNPSLVSDVEMVTDNLQYVIDFTNKTCELRRGNELAARCDIKVISKKSDQIFESQFTVPNNATTYGLVVNNEFAAYFDRFRVINITNFTSFFIN
jgi:hypothetical protein